jgi:ATP-dependent DNA helicase RecG
MLTESELLALMADLESFRVERTISTTDTDKFREAICSFANDMPGSGLSGYLLIGVDDRTGQPCGLTATDRATAAARFLWQRWSHSSTTGARRL